jgi:hypothetical protein
MPTEATDKKFATDIQASEQSAVEEEQSVWKGIVKELNQYV